MSSSQQPENAAPLLIRRRTEEEVQQTFQDNQKLNSSLTVAIATNPRPLADHPVTLPEGLADSDDDEEDDEEEDTGAGRSSETDALPITNAPNQQTRFTDTKWGSGTFIERKRDAPPLTMQILTKREREWRCLTLGCGQMNKFPEGTDVGHVLECGRCGKAVKYLPSKELEKGLLEAFGGRNKARDGSANVEEEGERSSSTLRGSLPDGGGEGGGALEV